NWVGITSTLFYVSNRVAALNPQGDLAALGMLYVTWSLAIEEQFYLAWPVLLRSLLKRPVLRRRLTLLVVLLLAASLILRAILFPGVPPPPPLPPARARRPSRLPFARLPALSCTTNGPERSREFFPRPNWFRSPFL